MYWEQWTKRFVFHNWQYYTFVSIYLGLFLYIYILIDRDSHNCKILIIFNSKFLLFSCHASIWWKEINKACVICGKHDRKILTYRNKHVIFSILLMSNHQYQNGGWRKEYKPPKMKQETIKNEHIQQIRRGSSWSKTDTQSASST